MPLIEQLANGDLLVDEKSAGPPRRVTKGTREHNRLLEAAAAGDLELRGPERRFGGPVGPPWSTVEAVFARLGGHGASPSAQRAAAADAAYGGRLALRELTALRRAGLLPFNKYRDA
jgi:hypothetical protein